MFFRAQLADGLDKGPVFHQVEVLLLEVIGAAVCLEGLLVSAQSLVGLAEQVIAQDQLVLVSSPTKEGQKRVQRLLGTLSAQGDSRSTGDKVHGAAALGSNGPEQHPCF